MHIALVGGGAAGLMAAAAIQETNPTAEVTLIERNTVLGRKVTISGGGRCNVTTGVHDLRLILSRYPRGGKFLVSAMHRFPPEAVMAWFEGHGVPLNTEADLRVFPASDHGQDVVAVFDRLFGASGSRIHVLLGCSVVHIARPATEFLLTDKQGGVIVADRVILTTGGQAYRHTGSTGDGYAFAESLGHTVTSLAPSLNSFTTKEQWPKQLAGCSLPWVRFTAPAHADATYDGPLLFTHHGVSGPAAFALSGLVAFVPIDAVHPLAMAINCFPDESLLALEQRLAARCHENGRKSMRTVLGFFLPKTLADVLCTETHIDGDMRAAQATKAMVAACAQWMHAIPLHVVGRGAGDEFVTAGGVDTNEVDPKTMESRICPGLFFAGEILNVDGFTGGFNLQASWATGRAAGEYAGRDHDAETTGRRA
ncbi:NAD(P)/FAD-dependent oxidoreductase [Candidatus Uhrbacteria bacterium]|nr:NAD(P)/FAD-dependent oxidoreductase [Candidatus Uhrbacteria bacterium]